MASPAPSPGSPRERFEDGGAAGELVAAVVAGRPQAVDLLLHGGEDGSWSTAGEILNQ